MRTVLQIDDDADIRELTAFAFELASGIVLLQAAGGAEGIRRALAEKPDLILLDFMMPELSGEDVLKALKKSQETRDIPIVFMSARTTPADEHHMRSLGAQDIIKKPFDPISLPDRVAQLITEAQNASEWA